jgi:hypothetical protein
MNELDLTAKTFGELADIVRAIREEVCNRPTPVKPNDFKVYPFYYWRVKCNQVIEHLNAYDEGDV